jgi:hypothetical protein
MKLGLVPGKLVIEQGQESLILERENVGRDVNYEDDEFDESRHLLCNP